MARSMVAAATSVGAVGHVVSFPMVSLTGQRRNDEDVLRLTNGWRIPMATMVAPVAYIAAVGGQEMANAAADGYVLMGETSAGIRRAQVGDVMTLRDGRFRPKLFTVGAIVPDRFVDWGDFYMTDTTASVLGALPISRVTVTGMSSSKSVIAAWKAKRFPIGSQFRLRTRMRMPQRKRGDCGRIVFAAANGLEQEFVKRSLIKSAADIGAACESGDGGCPHVDVLGVGCRVAGHYFGHAGKRREEAEVSAVERPWTCTQRVVPSGDVLQFRRLGQEFNDVGRKVRGVVDV